MTTKNLVILGGVAVAAIVAANLAGSGSARKAPQLSGKAIVENLDISKVAAIDIGGGKLKLAATDAGWTVSTYQDYPADRSKIAANLLKLQELKVGQVVRGRALGEETAVALRDGAGQSLAELKLGDKHMAKGGYYADGRYLAFGGETVLVSDALEAFNDDVKGWIDTKIVDEPWISFSELAAADLTPEELGFATGVTAKVTVAGDTNRVATIGATVKGGTDRYLKLDNSKWTFVVPSYSVEKLLPKPEPKAESESKAASESKAGTGTEPQSEASEPSTAAGRDVPAVS